MDRKSGYKTETILCSAILNKQNKVVGVLQLINKLPLGELFGEDDERSISHLNQTLSLSITRCLSLSSLESSLSSQSALLNTQTLALKRQENLAALNLEIGSDQQISQLIASVCRAATDLCSADRATLFLLDGDSGEIWSLVAHGSTEIRVKVGEGIAGIVAQSGQMLSIEDAYDDERFNRAVDMKSGYRTRSVLCLAIKGRGGDGEGGGSSDDNDNYYDNINDNDNENDNIVGVLQVINKSMDSNGGIFDSNDEEAMGALSVSVASAINRWQGRRLREMQDIEEEEERAYQRERERLKWLEEEERVGE